MATNLLIVFLVLLTVAGLIAIAVLVSLRTGSLGADRRHQHAADKQRLRRIMEVARNSR